LACPSRPSPSPISRNPTVQIRARPTSSVGVSEIDDSNFLVGVISSKEKHEPTEHFDLNGTPVLIWDGCIPFAEGIAGKRFDEIRDALLVVSFIHGVREAT
jgi:hypothetical protein